MLASCIQSRFSQRKSSFVVPAVECTRHVTHGVTKGLKSVKSAKTAKIAKSAKRAKLAKSAKCTQSMWVPTRPGLPSRHTAGTVTASSTPTNWRRPWPPWPTWERVLP